MRNRKALFVAAILGLNATPALAQWQDQVNAYDRDRLYRLEDSKAQGVIAAERGAPRRDLAIIHAVLDPAARPISGRELLGNWRCRQMKLGGLAPEIIYDWFRCRVRNTRNGLYFEKVTGTERISGYLEPYDGGRVLLMGELTVKKQRPKPYSGGNIGAGAATTSGDAVGVISRTGRGRARIEFPFPTIESVFDVMELKRD
jgi:hypothetical protein